MYSFENIIGERNSVLSPVINEKISKTPVFIDWKWPILLNGVSIGIKLWPRLDSLRLVTDTPKADLKVQIVDASFRLCVQRLDGGLMMAHEKMIKMEPAIYPYLKSDIKTTSIASGQYSFSVDDVFQGLVPCKLIVGLVSSAAYMGDYRKNPFYLRDYDCSSVGFYVDGQSYPSQPLRPNYEANQYIDSYRTRWPPSGRTLTLTDMTLPKVIVCTSWRWILTFPSISREKDTVA